MTSINDSLSPDLLFNIFKRLDCIQTTIVRRVCKDWFEIIEVHKSFWRTLHLPRESVEWDATILELFDRKSGSTLQDVEVEVEVGRELQTQFLDILEKSKATLKRLLLRFEPPYRVNNLLHYFLAVESLIVLFQHRSYKVRLRRTSVKRNFQDRSSTSGPLRALWYRADHSILEIDSARFKHLVSLDVGAAFSPSEVRGFLEGPSKNLKHLRLVITREEDEDHERVSTLQLSNLEVLELEVHGKFPRWLLFPDSVTLVAHSIITNLPSISELWLWGTYYFRNDIIHRLPKLNTLSLSYTRGLESALEILNERKSNVEAGLEVDGVKMEMIKTLLVPHEISSPDYDEKVKQLLNRCKELVELMKGKSQDEFIEVEI